MAHSAVFFVDLNGNHAIHRSCHPTLESVMAGYSNVRESTIVSSDIECVHVTYNNKSMYYSHNKKLLESIVSANRINRS